ncbi:MAG: hypothetical protein ACT4PL_05800, partial [Phycisphaerales bacterium]
ALVAERVLPPETAVVLGMGDGGKGGKVLSNPGVMPENAQIRTGWARLFGAKNADKVFDRLRLEGGVRMVSGPGLLAPVNEWASVTADSKDKPGQRVGIDFRVSGTPRDDGSMSLSFRAGHADGRAIASGTLRLSKGQALIFMVPPEKGETAHRLVMVRPSHITKDEDYPYQVFLPPPPPPAKGKDDGASPAGR